VGRVGRVPAREIAHLSREERRAKGGQARQDVPLSSHSGWSVAADRPDPVALLEAQNLTREPDLVPVRHGRMMVSPFTFYRGAAKIMAAWQQTLKTRPRRVSPSNCAVMRICRISACTPPPSGGWCAI
jgi:hypothetical protein